MTTTDTEMRARAERDAAQIYAATSSPLTAAQRTLVPDDGLGAHRTAPVETELRDINCEPGRRHLPWLAAEVVVADYRSQAYGRHTQVWLHNGPTTGELTPAEAREALEAMRGFIPKLEAVIALAEKTAADDFEGDPEIARADHEAEDRRLKAITEAAS